MLVQDLIQILEKLDPNKEITFQAVIEAGRGGSSITKESMDICNNPETGNYVFLIEGDEDEDGFYY